MMLFDAHTHIYDCFDLDVLFDAAFLNFRLAGEVFPQMAGNVCFLLLAEARGVNSFARLREMAGSIDRGGGAWSVSLTEEQHSLWIDHDDYPDARLVVVAGRQLVTREGLELLALLTEKNFTDGIGLEEAAKSITDQGGIAVCPWGAGKWLGKRGRILGELQRQSGGAPFLLGDSGVRPSIWPSPHLLRRASRHAKILSGSDPLPLPGEERRVGSYGSFLEGRCSVEAPAGMLRDRLLDPAVEVIGYGRQLSPMAFLGSQIALRLRQRRESFSFS